MILPIHAAIRSRLTQTLAATFAIADSDQPSIVIETPPSRRLGDLAVPVAFELARRLRKAPRAIAQDLAAALGEIDGVARVQAAPNGYLNFFLDRAAFLKSRLTATASNEGAPASEPDGGPGAKPPEKVIVEHT